MIKKVLIIGLLLSVLLPVYSQQNTRAEIAAISEEVSALRNEVRRLRADLEDMRIQNARLQEALMNSVKENKSGGSTPASVRVEMNEKLDDQKKEILKTVNSKIVKLAKDTNAAMDLLKRQVNKALGEGGNVSANNPSTPPRDMPDFGIEYKIKKGDTLSGIASRNRSKVSWILGANPNLKPSAIQVDDVIFIPQKKE